MKEFQLLLNSKSDFIQALLNDTDRDNVRKREGEREGGGRERERGGREKEREIGGGRERERREREREGGRERERRKSFDKDYKEYTN